MTKLILLKITFIVLGDTTLLFITFWIFCRRLTTYDARKLKGSNVNDMKTCWLSEYIFSCLTTLLEVVLRAACPTIEVWTLNPTSGETSVKKIILHDMSLSINPFDISHILKKVINEFDTSVKNWPNWDGDQNSEKTKIGNQKADF
jgi:hypothetical protein